MSKDEIERYAEQRGYRTEWREKGKYCSFTQISTGRSVDCLTVSMVGAQQGVVAANFDAFDAALGQLRAA